MTKQNDPACSKCGKAGERHGVQDFAGQLLCHWCRFDAMVAAIEYIEAQNEAAVLPGYIERKPGPLQ